MNDPRRRPPAPPASDDTAWVTRVLAAAPLERMPDDVTRRILAALDAEHEQQALGELAPGATVDEDEVDELVALQERTALGTFGENLPRAFTKQGLGIVREANEA